MEVEDPPTNFLPPPPKSPTIKETGEPTMRLGGTACDDAAEEGMPDSSLFLQIFDGWESVTNPDVKYADDPWSDDSAALYEEDGDEDTAWSLSSDRPSRGMEHSEK